MQMLGVHRPSLHTVVIVLFFFSSRRRHTRCSRDWSSDVCSSDLFVTLAAILTAIPAIPVQGLALLVGIEKFMSECRALTNVIGNGVATLVVSRWQGELDSAKLREVMSQPSEQATPPAA